MFSCHSGYAVKSKIKKNIFYKIHKKVKSKEAVASVLRIKTIKQLVSVL